MVVGSVKVNFLSYRYRADKSTIFGMRDLWGLTINFVRGATLKHKVFKSSISVRIRFNQAEKSKYEIMIPFE